MVACNISNLFCWSSFDSIFILHLHLCIYLHSHKLWSDGCKNINYPVCFLFCLATIKFWSGCRSFSGQHHSECSSTGWGGECVSPNGIKYASASSPVIMCCRLYPAPRWPGCRTQWSSGQPASWTSKGIWRAVSTCLCVQGEQTPIPPAWSQIYAHLDRWQSLRGLKWETILVASISYCCKFKKKS